ncbi:MAG: fibrobacter succinogenes major paralogous domain-containing protein [Bacteroidota bacterium]
MKLALFVLLLIFIAGGASSQQTYIFTGNGLWSNPANWSNGNVPPAILPSGSSIYLYAASGDTCLLDINQTIAEGASLNATRTKLIVAPGIQFTLSGKVNMYETNADSILICNHRWTTRNLDVTTYRNGDPIPLVTDPNVWKNLTYGAYCYINNDPANGAIYGPLYNWYAVNDPRGLLPAGWHIPSETEWNEIFDCLGGWSNAGGKMKEAGTVHWTSPNLGATNASGFTGLPGGYRNFQGTFGNVNGFGYWWSNTTNASNANQAWHFYLSYTSSQALSGYFEKTWGFSVRCIRD